MTSQYSFGIDPAHAGLRLDIFLSKNTPFPRSQIQKVIEKEGVKINNQIIKKANYRLKIGERVEFRYSAEVPQITPEPIALSIIYEDRYLLAINKPAGLVVQPGPGHYKGTLVHALLYYYPKLSNIGGANRPGIVHRLDKDTSGIMVIAKDVSMYNALIEQFKERKIEKEYLALVLGVPSKREGVIELPLGRHPKDRKRISVKTKRPRVAQTSWYVKEVFKNSALLLCRPRTGRTHQIRVHLSAIGHPIIGDPVYLRKARINKLKSKTLKTCFKTVKRPMLHALKIRIFHPIKGTFMQFEAPLPRDMDDFIQTLRALRDA